MKNFKCFSFIFRLRIFLYCKMVCLEKSRAYKMNIYYSSVEKVSNSRNFSLRGDLEAFFLFPDEEKHSVFVLLGE